jgi:hypothetical protein
MHSALVLNWIGYQAGFSGQHFRAASKNPDTMVHATPWV